MAQIADLETKKTVSFLDKNENVSNIFSINCIYFQNNKIFPYTFYISLI